MPPMSCTSKCRMFSVRRPASRTTAKASGSRSSSCGALRQALAERRRLRAQLLLGELPDPGLEHVDLLDVRAQTFQIAVILGADDLGKEGVEHRRDQPAGEGSLGGDLCDQGIP